MQTQTGHSVKEVNWYCLQISFIYLELPILMLGLAPNTLAPNQTGTATAFCTVTVADVTNEEVINTALAIGDDPTLTADDDPTVINLILRPLIALIKTAIFNDENKNGYAEIGETVTYHFAITNTGNVVLINIVVKDPKSGIFINGGPIILRQGETNTAAFTTYLNEPVSKIGYLYSSGN